MPDVPRTFNPTVSAEWAMREFSEARDAERDALLSLVELRPGQVIVDLQAAGGYLGTEIGRRLDWQAEILCVEPTADLSRRIDPRCRVVADPLDAMTSIADDSVDVVIGLAGLHHSPSKSATVRESFRMLKPGGVFAVCDVRQNSPVARWLNEYVDRHNPGGHKGDFLADGEITALMRAAGFTGCEEEERSVPWRMKSEADLGRFFCGLFGLVSTEQDVIETARRMLGVETTEWGVSIPWTLIYARARKPGRGCVT
jgi:SAM-dependent methyltransferase